MARFPGFRPLPIPKRPPCKGTTLEGDKIASLVRLAAQHPLNGHGGVGRFRQQFDQVSPSAGGRCAQLSPGSDSIGRARICRTRGAKFAALLSSAPRRASEGASRTTALLYRRKHSSLVASDG